MRFNQNLVTDILGGSSIGFSGCATRHYVKHQVAPLEVQAADVRNVMTQQGERIDAAHRRAKAAIDIADNSSIPMFSVQKRSAAWMIWRLVPVDFDQGAEHRIPVFSIPAKT